MSSAPGGSRTARLAHVATADLAPKFDAWWRTRAARRSGTDEATALDRLLPFAEALTDAFTTDRPGDRFPAYLQAPELLDAYGLTFFPRSFHRAAWVMAELLARGWTPGPGPVRILDLGSGPAPAGLAAASVLASSAAKDGSSPPSISLVAADHAGPALQAARDLASLAELPGLALEAVPCDLGRRPKEAPGGQPGDLVLACLVLNEIVSSPSGPDDAATDDEALRHLRLWARWLKPGGRLVVMEPAAPATARRLQRLRNPLAESGLHVHAPCLHGETCPLLAERGLACHEVRHAAPEAGAEYLNRKLHRRVAELRWSFLALGREPAPRLATASPPGHHGRLVAPFAALKGRHVTRICAADGQLHSWDLPAKLLSADDADHLPERGDLVEATAITPLGGERQHRLASPPREIG